MSVDWAAFGTGVFALFLIASALLAVLMLGISLLSTDLPGDIRPLTFGVGFYAVVTVLLGIVILPGGPS